MPAPLSPTPLADIRAARTRIADLAVRTPLVRLNAPEVPGEIHLKLECLQPIGSFKIRGAGNALTVAGEAALAQGVHTASAGNMGQGVAYVARRLGVGCSVVVPDHAPATKLDALKRLGAEVVKIPFDQWWHVMLTHEFAGLSGVFVHPVADPHVMAGNGTIGLEILEDLPDVATIVVPYGGGGLSCGIASAVKALRPATRVIAAEVDTAAPLSASLAADRPMHVDYTPSFVDGIGGSSVLTEMWPVVRDLIDEAIACPLSAVADAVRLLVERNRVVAEGAGAAAVAAAVSAARRLDGPVVCVVSGGNIDAGKLAVLLGGGVV